MVTSKFYGRTIYWQEHKQRWEHKNGKPIKSSTKALFDSVWERIWG